MRLVDRIQTGAIPGTLALFVLLVAVNPGP